MKINEVIAREGDYETSDQNKMLAELGRTLMDMSAKMKMTDDAAIKTSNDMARLGDELTAFGTSFGAKTPKELSQKVGLDMPTINQMLKMAQAELKKAGPVRGGEDVPDDEPEEF